MPTVNQVMAELKKKGSAQTRKTYARHGAPEDAMFGVKVGDLKPIAKRLRGEQQLALDLYATGNSDAMYLAGIVADGATMNKTQLNAWAKGANWYMLSEYTVPGVAAESPHALSLANKWINSKTESIAACGWCTYSFYLSITPDPEIEMAEVKQLLKEVRTKIHTERNRVRHCMNAFVIAVGSFVKPLHKQALTVAKKIGKVSVDMGDTACKVPLATEYIAKVESMGRVGKKRNSAKC